MSASQIDVAREQLLDQVFQARTLSEIGQAKLALRSWLEAHPDEPGMADAFEALSHFEDFASQPANGLSDGSEVQLEWSDEILFERKEISANVPPHAGVYVILQNIPYHRYRGTTRVLEIGKSENLRAELLNHFGRHTAANRLCGVRGCPGITVSIRYTELDRKAVGYVEKKLLQAFEMEHWDLPLLNAQRGFTRGKDLHYRSEKQKPSSLQDTKVS
jgi:hypothetical protein